MIVNRRDFMRIAGVGLAGLLTDASLSQYALAQPARPKAPLIAGVEGVCRRLAQHGWRDLLLRVTSNELDLASSNLAGELAKKLTTIRRDLPGFEDFAAEGQRGIEPGNPARSLLFHALASPAVLQGAPGKPLTGFPTLAELEAVENYVYGVKPPTLAELQASAGNTQLAVVVFAPEYRTMSHTVLRRHADMAFSRTACARVGNAPPHYDARRRDFVPLDDQNARAFRVMPARFAPYIAMKVKGRRDSYVPMRFQKEDDSRDFWVPLHKLFSGTECIAGLDLDVRLAAQFLNQKLRRFHQLMLKAELCTGWSESDIDKHPFVMKDGIADFSARSEDGQGLVTPVPHPLFERARYEGKLLAFWVPPDYEKAQVNLWFSTMQILPDAADTLFPQAAYMGGLNPELGRTAPEYINTRRRLNLPLKCSPEAGKKVPPTVREEDLNQKDGLLKTLKKGGYWSIHFIDYTADGWVAAICPQLPQEYERVPAYSPVAPPDFFPAVMQRELMEWWKGEDVPRELKPGLWSIEPLALCDSRMSANVELKSTELKPVFRIDDDTVTAIVGHPSQEAPRQMKRPANETTPFTRLPDGSNGVFDPGWDVSQGRDEQARKMYLHNHGLGVPFIEDVKLCAALGSFWPAVVPDSTRMFQPIKKPEGDPWPWPTNVPLTDEEIGIVKASDGQSYPWDGVEDGPQIRKDKSGQEWVDYPDINHVDYTILGGKMTAKLTSRIDLKEYGARVLAMARVYRALGVHFEKQEGNPDEAANRLQFAKSQWAVFSFRKLDAQSAGLTELRAAEQQSKTRLRIGETYWFHVYSPGKEVKDKENFKRVRVEMKEQTFFYVDGENVLRRNGNGKWERVETS
jgi:hypothetical protein